MPSRQETPRSPARAGADRAPARRRAASRAHSASRARCGEPDEPAQRTEGPGVEHDQVVGSAGMLGQVVEVAHAQARAARPARRSGRSPCARAPARGPMANAPRPRPAPTAAPARAAPGKRRGAAAHEQHARTELVGGGGEGAECRHVPGRPVGPSRARSSGGPRAPPGEAAPHGRARPGGGPRPARRRRARARVPARRRAARLSSDGSRTRARPPRAGPGRSGGARPAWDTREEDPRGDDARPRRPGRPDAPTPIGRSPAGAAWPRPCPQHAAAGVEGEPRHERQTRAPGPSADPPTFWRNAPEGGEERGHQEARARQNIQRRRRASTRSGRGPGAVHSPIASAAASTPRMVVMERMSPGPA